MSFFSKNLARLSIACILMAMSPGLLALGLGNAKVESYLDQPLNVSIELLTRPGEDLESVTARLASAEDYALIGADRESISVPLSFTVNTQAAQPYVRVTSSLAVKEPIVRLILELNWSSGRLLREYTLFLDPPLVPAAAPPPVIDERRDAQPPRVDPVSQTGSEPDPVAGDMDSVPEAAEETAQENRQFSGDGEFGPVQSGDTLWRIATDWSAGSGANVNQVMLAIQRNNPQAFINNNINLLKRGAILRMPDSADIQSISATDALEEVLEQSELFASGSSNAATTPAPVSTAPAVETPLVDVASDMSSEAQPDAVADTGAQLEIVPPSADSNADSAYGDEDSPESGTASTSVVNLEEELARKEEALITEQQTNEYLQERIKELESRLASTDSADMTVEDAELAGMEGRLREQRLSEQQAGENASSENAVQARPDTPTVQTSTRASEAPWYTSWVTWLIALLVAGAAGFGWYRSKFGAQEYDLAAAAAEAETVREIKNEAEEILKTLDSKQDAETAAAADGDSGPSEEPDDETPSEVEQEPEETDIAEPEPGIEPVKTPFRAKSFEIEEASILDEDSADPEVRLDLARAYISMGDKEAARAILGEVVEHGDEKQQAEAQAMLDRL